MSATSLSLLCHSLAVAALLMMFRHAPTTARPEPVLVSLVQAPQPAHVPARSPSQQPARAAAAKAAAVKTAMVEPRRAPTPAHAPAPKPVAHRPNVKPSRASSKPPSGEEDDEGTDASVGLSDADVAGATTAGAGAGAGAGGGGACDMVARLQEKLRTDPLVQAAMAGARVSGGRNILVWNGDWVRSGGEDGKGLAAVREAIMWEVAFAPAACRSQPVRGRVLLSLNEASRSARLVLGGGTWRWKDLLAVRGVSADGTAEER